MPSPPQDVSPLLSSSPGVSGVVIHVECGNGDESDMDMQDEDPSTPESRAVTQERLSHLLVLQSSFTEKFTPNGVAALTSAEIEACKAHLRSTRTPGRKLDGLRGAIQRCEKRAAKAEQDIADANVLLLEATDRHTMERSALEKHRSELQQLEEELATHQNPQLFRESSPAQLPPEIMLQQAQMTQQIASLNQELCKQALAAQQELAMPAQHAQQALAAQ